MAGITSIGAYIPKYRINLEEVAKFWRTRSAGGEKAVAGYDEDSITMAVGAAFECMRCSKDEVDGVYFATTTHPYKEKQGAAIIASAIDLKRESLTADFTNSLRSATIALGSALNAVQSGAAKNIMVTASDCRLGAPQGKFEQQLGDGAAAVSDPGIGPCHCRDRGPTTPSSATSPISGEPTGTPSFSQRKEDSSMSVRLWADDEGSHFGDY